MTVVYCFNEPVFDGVTLIGNEVVEMTREEILESPWGSWWKNRMKEKYGEGHPLINDDECVNDFVVVNWAWTKERPDE